MEHCILQGHAVVEAPNLLAWAKWWKDTNRTVKKTQLSDGVEVSTVFLGLQHGFDDEGAPMLFETMVFGGEHDQDMERYATYGERYATWRQAERGHARMVAALLGEEREHA